MEQENDKAKHPKRLSRQITVVCLAFIATACVLISVLSYFNLHDAIIERYQNELGDILDLTISQIDADDLEKCISENEESEKFRELESFVDDVRRNTSVAYIAIVKPEKNGDSYDVKAVLTGLLPEERAGQSYHADMAVPHLGDSTAATYSPELMAQFYNDMLHHEGIKFSTARTAYGETYDGAASIRNSSGKPIALITAGISTDDIKNAMALYVGALVGFAIIVGFVFLFFMAAWFKRRVANPIARIERAANEFAQKSHGQTDPDALVLDFSDIKTGDELQSLAESLQAMSHDMKKYVEDIISSKREIARVSEIALKDALTGVRNKMAFDRECERLDGQIAEGSAEFALVMVDLNDLKHINDAHGHSKGDVFIKTACSAICNVFVHSPVFRIGGDEFVVLLEHHDFEDREELLAKLQNTMQETATAEEWLRVSVATGLAIFDTTIDNSADDVLKRADANMYRAKKDMKA